MNTFYNHTKIHWRIQGHLPPLPLSPMGPNSVIFTYVFAGKHLCRTSALTTRLVPLQRVILDPENVRVLNNTTAPLSIVLNCGKISYIYISDFQHVVFGICRLIDILVPDVPESLEIKIKRERYLAKQALADTETIMKVCIFVTKSILFSKKHFKYRYHFIFQCVYSYNVVIFIVHFDYFLCKNFRIILIFGPLQNNNIFETL